MSEHRIETVEAIPLEAPVEEPFGYAQAWVDTRKATLVRIETADGTVGWGECWGPTAGTLGTIEELLAPELIGEDPTRVEALSDRLYERTRAAYQSVVPLPALSGVDIALWDLKGRLLDTPVTALLGGARRDRVRAYATGHYFKQGASLEEQYERIAAEASENADAIGALKAKIGLGLLGYGAEEDIELVARIREAVGDATLMVDANYAYDPATAREVGRALEEFDVHWFEEPVRPELLGAYADLRETLDVRIAGGECHTPQEFTRALDVGGFDVAQPDLCNVGGLTAARRITAECRAAGVPVVPHVWGTPIALAASLSLIATLPGEPWLEFDRSANPLREELSPDPFVADDSGRVPIPSGAGLGIELDEEAIERYRR
ncbi:mandelate racemase/muconate lactonizing enzyme family protein [Natronomonas sp. F2-12]|uniref:Mandelate racemase/muconate lactonizing enzyme family protein n=1 Tax=Natronomonas aquatica TaxID=2841590 RepID=A0A9R1D6F9_9EURY|nr:mandelate racemase/muconate lactonizing enzyme family protein [Natronomonas aquatica]MCQ4331990.1 mandelate racemase/muconate lactonizing enzyme family protein [Natronomonas aquatica]